MGITKTKQKGSTEETLPSRFALTTITKGDPSQRTMNNYASKTPGVGSDHPNIYGMGARSGYGSGY